MGKKEAKDLPSFTSPTAVSAQDAMVQELDRLRSRNEQLGAENERLRAELARVSGKAATYWCASPACPGYPFRASDMPHPPDTCGEGAADKPGIFGRTWTGNAGRKLARLDYGAAGAGFNAIVFRDELKAEFEVRLADNGDGIEVRSTGPRLDHALQIEPAAANSIRVRARRGDP